MRAIPALIAPVLGAFALGALAARPAAAGETQCWLDNGVVVVPAALGGIAGDFILDLAAPVSQLHLTVAQSFGIGTPSLDAPLILAGETTPASFAVTDLDARGWGFPTSIAGVIGEDVLANYVVQLRFAPCRLTLWRKDAPALTAAQTYPVTMIAGVPAIAATASDGTRSVRGRFAVDTGSSGVRLADSLAHLSRVPPKGVDPDARIDPPARLAGVELGDQLLTGAPASLQAQTPDGLAGSLGDVVWTRYAWMRLDVRRGRLELGPPVR